METIPIRVVGTSFGNRQQLLKIISTLPQPITAHLVQDLDNEFSKNAVMVMIDVDAGRAQVGFIPEKVKSGWKPAKEIFDKIDAGINFRAHLTVHGGGEGRNFGATVMIMEDRYHGTT